MSEIPIGRSLTVRQGTDIAILAFGSMVQPCRAVAKQLNATLINMRFVKPLDSDAILTASRKYTHLVTVEENAVAGGAGSGVNELLAANGHVAAILNLGLDDTFIQHGTREECLHQAGLDENGILNSILQFTGRDLSGNAVDKMASQTGS